MSNDTTYKQIYLEALNQNHMIYYKLSDVNWLLPNCFDIMIYFLVRGEKKIKVNLFMIILVSGYSN